LEHTEHTASLRSTPNTLRLFRAHRRQCVSLEHTEHTKSLWSTPNTPRLFGAHRTHCVSFPAQQSGRGVKQILPLPLFVSLRKRGVHLNSPICFHGLHRGQIYFCLYTLRNHVQESVWRLFLLKHALLNGPLCSQLYHPKEKGVT
jgi:hypothetical protein